MVNYRYYQERGINIALDHIYSSSKSAGVLVYPTAAGKSFCIAGIADRYNGPILVLQPSKELLAQNYSKFKLVGGEASIFSASFNSKEVSHVTFATIGSIKKDIETLNKLKNLVVLVDECHFKSSPELKSEFRQFMKELKYFACIGLTATPFRLVPQRGGSILKMINRTNPRFFSKILFVQQISEIIELGYWAKSIDYSWDYDETSLSLNTTGSDFTDQSIKKTNEANNINRSICVQIHKLLAEGKRKSILVFVDSVANCHVMAEYFSSYTKCAVVTGKTSIKERDASVEGFKSGEIPILLNHNCFSTGFDHPELDTIILGRPTNSLSNFYQIYGRGVRIHENKEDFLFIDCCGNFNRLCHPRDIVIKDCEVAGWAVYAGDRIITGFPLNLHITKEDLISSKESENSDFGNMPFGKWKGKPIEYMCTHDPGYASWMIDNMDSSQYGPTLKNKITEALRAVTLKNNVNNA